MIKWVDDMAGAQAWADPRNAASFAAKGLK